MNAKASRTRALRTAAAACLKIAKSWDREAHRRIKGGGDDDDWGEPIQRAETARECARAILAKLTERE